MRLCATFIFALILALPLAGHGQAADSQPTEYQLKAAYLYHFAQFVDWPPAAFPQPNSPLIIGVLGDNPFGNDLPHTVEGKVLNNHPLIVQEYHSLAEMTNSCHILFISSSEKKHLPEIFAALKGTSVLTVSEKIDHFIEDGGMINFVLEKDRIRFQINETTVEKAGLKMSFKLLSLASKVTH
jgi:hypothetical protein